MRKVGLVLFIMLSSNLFGADPSIYTWGYGEIFYKVLQGVTIISKESYLITSAVAIGGFLLMIKNTANGGSSSDMSVAMGKYLFIVTIIIGMFSTQTKTYVVEDEITGQAFPVNNVPIGIGETFSLFTDLERNLAKGFEIAFSTPNSISYSKTGLGFTMAAPINLGGAVMVDAYVVRTFNEYMGNCVFSAIAANEMSGDILTMSKNLKTDLSVTGYLTPYYSSLNPEGVDMQCQDAWANITVALGTKLDDMEQIAANKMMLDQTTFQSGMSETTRMIFGMSQNSKDYLMQQTLINLSNDGIKAVALATGGDASALAYAKALSETNQQQTWTVTGMLAQQNLPLMKATMTVLILGIFILLVLLSVIYGDLGHIKMGFTLLFAMVLWTPLALLVNGMFNVAIERILPSISNGGMNMVNINDISDGLKNYLAFLGYMAASIPVFAYSIAKKSEHGFVSLFGGVGAASTSAASSATSQTSSGNISAGNSRLGSFNATDMYGTHDYLGNDSWRNNFVSDNGTMRSSYRNKHGEGTASTDAGGLGDIAINSKGEVVKYANNTFNANTVDGLSHLHTSSKQELMQKSRAVSDAAAANIANTLSSGGQVITTGTFTDSKGQQHQTGESLNSAMNESAQKTLNEMVSSGKTNSFSTEDAAKVGAGVTVGTPKFIGASAQVDASVSMTGKTSSGEDVSFKLSGTDAESFMKSYTKNLSEQISETDGLTHALAKQTQETKGFADNDSISAALNYTKAYQDSEAISKAYSVAQKQDFNLSEDLNPKMLNKVIDTATTEDGKKLSDIKKYNATYAAELGAEMLRKDKALQETTMRQVTREDFDTNQAKNAVGEIAKAENKLGVDAKNYINKGTELEKRAETMVEKAKDNLSDLPTNKRDIEQSQREILNTYNEKKGEHFESSSKNMKGFENNNSLAAEKNIDTKIQGLEEKRKTAQDETGMFKAMELNPLVKKIKTLTEVVAELKDK